MGMNINDFLAGKYAPAPKQPTAGKQGWTTLTDFLATPVDSKLVDEAAQNAAVAKDTSPYQLRINDDGSFNVVGATGQTWTGAMMGSAMRDKVAQTVNAIKAGSTTGTPLVVTYANNPKTAQDAFNLANGIGAGQFAFKTGEAADKASSAALNPGKAIKAGQESTRNAAEFAFAAQEDASTSIGESEGEEGTDSSDPLQRRNKKKVAKNAFFTGGSDGA